MPHTRARDALAYGSTSLLPVPYRRHALSPVRAPQAKLPPDFKRDIVNAQIKSIGGMGRPLNICLSQEVDRLHKVLSVVRRMLINLKLAIAGARASVRATAARARGGARGSLRAAALRDAIAHGLRPGTFALRSPCRGRHDRDVCRALADARRALHGARARLLATSLAARDAEHRAVVGQHPLAQRAADLVAGQQPAQRLLADRLFQPAGLLDREPAGGLPEARKGQLGARRHGGLVGSAQTRTRTQRSRAHAGRQTPCWPKCAIRQLSHPTHPRFLPPRSSCPLDRPQEKDELKRGPEEGVYIYGLYLDGCKWDKTKERLVDSDPKVLYASLPVIHIGAVLSANKRSAATELYACPLYKTPKRTGLNFVTSIELRTEEHPNKWVLRGVCLLCSKD